MQYVCQLKELRVSQSCINCKIKPHRGGDEDTRLEAKAYDTKKIRSQGQEQPFRGQILSRPKTEMLETKDTGANVLPKTKKKQNVFKIVSRRFPKKRKSLHNNLSGDLLKDQVFKIIFQAIFKLLTNQEIVLSSSRRQGNFRGLEASRPTPRTFSRTLPLEIWVDKQW